MDQGRWRLFKLGVQITYETLKSGDIKYAIYLLEAQKKGAQMHILRIRLHRPWWI